jgi:hypothetical protein
VAHSTSIPAPTLAASRQRELSWWPRLLRRDLLGVGGLTIVRMGWTALFIVLFSIWSAIANALAEHGSAVTLASVRSYLESFVEVWSMSFIPSMILVSIADNLPLAGRARVAALAGALVLGAVCRSALEFLLVPSTAEWEALTDAEKLGSLTAVGIGALAYTTPIAIAYFTRRRDQIVAGALHASVIARLDAERARLQSELQALQARVEPAFLDDALCEIAKRYELDPAAGARLFDALIAYLRTALPQLRDNDTTLGREVRLLRSYLELIAQRSDGTLGVRCAMDPALDNARFPPMVLLPLVASAAAARSCSGTIDVEALETAGRVRVVISASGHVARVVAEWTAQHAVRERLGALYGEPVPFAIDRTAADRLLLIMELPLSIARNDERTQG